MPFDPEQFRVYKPDFSPYRDYADFGACIAFLNERFEGQAEAVSDANLGLKQLKEKLYINPRKIIKWDLVVYKL